MEDRTIDELGRVVFNTPNGKKLLDLMVREYIHGFTPSKHSTEAELMIRLGKEELVKDLYSMANSTEDE